MNVNSSRGIMKKHSNSIMIHQKAISDHIIAMLALIPAGQYPDIREFLIHYDTIMKEMSRAIIEFDDEL